MQGSAIMENPKKLAYPIIASFPTVGKEKSSKIDDLNKTSNMILALYKKPPANNATFFFTDCNFHT